MSKQDLTYDNSHKNQKYELQTLPGQSSNSLKSLACAQAVTFQKKTNSILLILGMIMISRKSQKYIKKINEIYKLQVQSSSQVQQEKNSQRRNQIATNQIEKIMQIILLFNPKQQLQQFLNKLHQASYIIQKDQKIQNSFIKSLRLLAYQLYIEKSLNFQDDFLNIDKQILFNTELELRGDSLDLLCQLAQVSLNFIFKTAKNQIIEKYGKQYSQLQMDIKLQSSNPSEYSVNLCIFPQKHLTQNSEEFLSQTTNINGIHSPKNSMGSIHRKKWQRNPSSEKSLGKCRICLKHNQICFCRKSRKQFTNDEQTENRQLSKLKFYRNFCREKENIVVGNGDKNQKKDYLQMYQNKLVREFKLKNSNSVTQSLE